MATEILHAGRYPDLLRTYRWIDNIVDLQDNKKALVSAPNEYKISKLQSEYALTEVNQSLRQWANIIQSFADC